MKLIKGKKYVITGFNEAINTKEEIKMIKSLYAVKFPQTVLYGGEYFLVKDNTGISEYAVKWFIFKETNPATIEIYKSRGQFKFRVINNGKVLNHLYQSKQGCKKGIEALAKAMSNYKIVDLTK
jgi:uncharacterized protein YegP (UPF0339 family)